MSRKFSEPDKRKRKRAPVLAMIAEGDNETEKRYFNWFKKAFKNRLPYRIDFLNTRNGTEPEQMLNNAIQRYKEKELNKEDGDRLIIFVDLDCKEEKYQAIMRLAKKAKQHNIIFCYSNPCFEIWYLDHYRKTSREYENSDKAVKELKTYVFDYSKSKEINSILKDKMGIAYQNERDTQDYMIRQNLWPADKHRPMTLTVEVIDLLNLLSLSAGNTQ